METYYTIINTEVIEINFSDLFCKSKKCPVCKTNKLTFVANKWPVVGLRKLKSCKVQKDSNVILGDLNLLGWVVLKSYKKIIDYLNKLLAKLCAIQK